MPRYHFNVYDGVSVLDRDGTDLPDLAAARREGIALAGALISEEADKLSACEVWHMEIVDAEEHLCFRLDFQMIDFPLGAFAL